MNRIEEIKHRVEQIDFTNKKPPETNCYVPMRVEEMQFILSLNDRYKEALKKLQRKAYIEGYAEMLHVINTEMEALEE